MSEEQRRRRRGRAVHEVTALTALDNDGVPRVLHHNTTEFADLKVTLFVVLELIEGPTLGEHLAEHGTMETDDVVRLLRRLGAVLARCHSNEPPFVHTDIKPDNIILRHGAIADAHLIDFGIVGGPKVEGVDSPTLTEEQKGNRFLPLPELIDTNDRTDHPQSDIAQLAGVALFALTGRTPGPWRDGQDRAPHDRVADSIRGIPSGSRGRLFRAFDRAFQTRPERRHETVEQLVVELARALGESEAADPFEDEFERMQQWVEADSQAEVRQRWAIFSVELERAWRKAEKSEPLHDSIPVPSGLNLDLHLGQESREPGSALPFRVRLSYGVVGQPPLTHEAIIKFHHKTDGALVLIAPDSDADRQVYRVGAQVDDEMSAVVRAYREATRNYIAQALAELGERIRRARGP